MGEFGANGIGGIEEDRAKKPLIDNDAIDTPAAALEPAEIADLDTSSLENFAASWAAQSPDESMEMFGALQHEIYEAYGIIENSPEAIDPNIQTRIEALAGAVRTNEPQEIAQNLNSLFDGAIDSPERLNQLAGLILGQGGGNFEGLSIGGKNPLTEAQLRDRRDNERANNAFTLVVSAEAIVRAAENAAAAAFGSHKQTFANVNTWLQDNKALPIQQQIDHTADAVRPAYEDAVDAQMAVYKEANPDATEEELKAFHEQAIEEASRLTGDALEASPAVEAGVLAELESAEAARFENSNQRQAAAIKLVVDSMHGFSADASIEDVQEALSANISEQIGLLNQSIFEASNAMETELARANPSVDYLAALTSFRDAQQLKLNISIEIFAYQETVFGDLIAEGKELSDLEMSDIQKIIFDVPEDLINQIEKLKELQPNQNPMQFMEDLMGQFTAENGYTDEQIQEVEKMMSDLQHIVGVKTEALNLAQSASDQLIVAEGKLEAANAKLAELEAYEAELEEALSETWEQHITQSEGSDFEPAIGPAGPGNTLSPMYDTGQEIHYLQQATQEQREKLEALRSEAEALQTEALELQAAANAALFEASQAQTMLEVMKSGKTFEEAKAIADALEPPEPPQAPPAEEEIVVAEADTAAVEEEVIEHEAPAPAPDLLAGEVDEISNRILAELDANNTISQYEIAAFVTEAGYVPSMGTGSVLTQRIAQDLQEKMPVLTITDNLSFEQAARVEATISNVIDIEYSDGISKQDLSLLFQDVGLEGEQLAASIEQTIANLQAEKGMDFVQGLEWPAALEVSGLESTPEPSVNEPVPSAEPSTPAPKTQDYEYAQNNPGPGVSI